MSTFVGSLPDFPIQNNVDPNNGNVDKELPDFNRTIEFNPGFSAAFMNHGSIHANTKYYGFVFCDCNKAVTPNPSYAEASTTRDEFHIKKQTSTEQLRTLHRLIEILCIPQAATMK